MSAFSRSIQKNAESEEQDPSQEAPLPSPKARIPPTRSGPVHALLAILCAANSVFAEGAVGVLIDQLKNGADFRIRTQAALALGASADPSVTAPLCEALDDTSETVRSAAAAALGKLKNPAGVPCLRNHMGDTNAAVRFVIERSLNELQGPVWPAPPPPPGPNDAFYVIIGPVTDRTGRDDKTVLPLVGATMQDKLLSVHGYAVAPQGESGAATMRVIKQKNLRCYLLLTRVEPPRPSGNNLTIQVRVTMSTYPGKALQSEFTPTLTMSGASAGDKESEDTLIRMAIEKAIESFVRVTSAIN
jgi:hypothetical protein